MAMTVSMARRYGLDKLAVPTQGNAGDSLCTYAEAAGLQVVVAMPRDTPLPILGRVAALAHASQKVELVLVDGTIREAGAALKQDWIPRGYFSVATFQDPGWRIEGKKTLGLELAEPDTPGQRWSLPDVIIYPTGGGTGLIGMWKAFREMEEMGWLGQKRPRMVSVQASGCAPIVRAFNDGKDTAEPWQDAKTVASGLRVPQAVADFLMLQALRESKGTALSVSDEAMLAEIPRVGRAEGIFFCPEGAACVAALRQLTQAGWIKPTDEVLIFNTASGLKYLDVLQGIPVLRDGLKDGTRVFPGLQ